MICRAFYTPIKYASNKKWKNTTQYVYEITHYIVWRDKKVVVVDFAKFYQQYRYIVETRPNQHLYRHSLRRKLVTNLHCFLELHHGYVIVPEKTM